MDWEAQFIQLALIALAGALGGVIGLEREFADKPAGLRTHFFVAASAALLTFLGERLVTTFVSENPDQVINADPTRVIHAIVLGIGFLGAGTIVRENRDGVEGLTTAASVFLTAGVGIAVAAGSYVLAVGCTVGAVTVLISFRSVDAWVRRYRDRSG